MKGEVVETLRFLRRELPQSRVFLSLRDVIDDPSHVIPLWKRLGVFDALDRYYDGIFIYGRPVVYDAPAEYQFPKSLQAKSHFCGYIPRPADHSRSEEIRKELGLGRDRLVVVTVGGGADGARLIEAFLRALPLASRSEPLPLSIAWRTRAPSRVHG